MNKFMKLAVVMIVVIGLSVTVYRVSKRSGGEVAENSPAGETSGNSSENSEPTTETPDNKKNDSAPVGKGDDVNSDDFMGGVTGKSVGVLDGSKSGSDKAGAGGSDDPNAVPREDGNLKTSGHATGVDGSAPGSLPSSSLPNSGVASKGVAGPDAAKPDSNCFAFEYKHQKEALNKDIEDFLDFSNAFPILHNKVASKSICVKVNGKPVAHKVSQYKNQQEVVIGSVVGPESVIKVSYCIGAATCKEACAVKTNRFMDDLMSDTGDEDEFKESWGDSKEQKKELTAKVKEFRNVASENKDLQKQSTIRNWDTVQTNDWVCKK